MPVSPRHLLRELQAFREDVAKISVGLDGQASMLKAHAWIKGQMSKILKQREQDIELAHEKARASWAEVEALARTRYPMVTTITGVPLELRGRNG